MYNVTYELEKEIQKVSTQTEPYRQAYCQGDLQECSEGGDREQEVLKVVVKLAVATVTPPILNLELSGEDSGGAA